ncbi:DUF262 domain-containing HNH endonuclease family protein [Cytobacillus oceanisediminis]|uniref:DUF262 domain-containing protein n=1 Tax=Cytobacillus oceanisediminis TaxID=665099 RepID=UPI0023D9D8D2|nr:DUF262 domain-containing HNH endonuclease family protein [Cytobacillus oceanisediminis]MDF2036334.1 DUF262 domain-containing HNH endonuclease family protein [Cytobacillus oceanisediminis]
MNSAVEHGSIDAKKSNIATIFEKFWFIIPEYQRSYVWETDNINDLLDDLWYAYENKSDSEYFLGSLVLRDLNNNSYKEYEVLDGQQRLTTLFMLLSVIRDTSNNQDLLDTYSDMLFQKKNVFKGIPERVRILYKIRDSVESFISESLIKKDGTKNTDFLKEKLNEDNTSIKNMANAIITMRKFFEEKVDSEVELFAQFLAMKVIFIYVSTDNREDAFRLFTILNNRGIPLTSADILKSINIGEIESDSKKYARVWEDIEGELGDEFDRFLSFVRTILVKEKARVNLLEEFEENVYKKGKLSKGIETIKYIQNYKSVYDNLILFKDNQLSNDFKNLITIMLIGLPSDDWIPSLMYYYNKFGRKDLTQFLKKLEYKFVGDWILQFTSTQRIENMNKILKQIELAASTNEVLGDTELFFVEKSALRDILNKNIYGRRFARYILLKYEYLESDNTVHLADYKTISVEHILPQSPKASSNWAEGFDLEQRQFWTHKLANLVLISKRKNASLSNLDFEQKREKYLEKRIDVFAGSKVFILTADKWTPTVLETRQKKMLDLLINN